MVTIVSAVVVALLVPFVFIVGVLPLKLRFSSSGRVFLIALASVGCVLLLLVPGLIWRLTLGDVCPPRIVVELPIICAGISTIAAIFVETASKRL